jgi:hypothetical protein
MQSSAMDKWTANQQLAVSDKINVTTTKPLSKCDQTVHLSAISNGEALPYGMVMLWILVFCKEWAKERISNMNDIP